MERFFTDNDPFHSCVTCHSFSIYQAVFLHFFQQFSRCWRAQAIFVLLSYANGKIEELDARRQQLIKEIAALNAETISPQKIEFLSAHLENWNTIDFDDRRQVTDIILSQVQATSDRVSFKWKI